MLSQAQYGAARTVKRATRSLCRLLQSRPVDPSNELLSTLVRRCLLRPRLSLLQALDYSRNDPRFFQELRIYLLLAARSALYHKLQARHPQRSSCNSLLHATALRLTLGLTTGCSKRPFSHNGSLPLLAHEGSRQWLRLIRLALWLGLGLLVKHLHALALWLSREPEDSVRRLFPARAAVSHSGLKRRHRPLGVHTMSDVPIAFQHAILGLLVSWFWLLPF
ncbi:hypothetical protein BV20DRAFT_397027 [Pilatotrama ljubarskyi]|nr:hypothetical protein BV20DRAFT_397027 [Pilatotrama ljubarskyi]